jgi:hypothetical protein
LVALEQHCIWDVDDWDDVKDGVAQPAIVVNVGDESLAFYLVYFVLHLSNFIINNFIFQIISGKSRIYTFYNLMAKIILHYKLIFNNLKYLIDFILQ